MKLILKPETERYIDEQVKAGRFASREELVEIALAEFQATAASELDGETIAAINEGLDQADRGEGMTLDAFRTQFFKRS